jgi:hypothetical protein
MRIDDFHAPREGDGRGGITATHHRGIPGARGRRRRRQDAVPESLAEGPAEVAARRRVIGPGLAVVTNSTYPDRQSLAGSLRPGTFN